MTTVLLALSAVPLAIYFFLLGVWQGGRDPRVIPGPVDFGLLAFGVGGLLAFGPIGQAMAALLFGSAGVLTRLALLLTLGMGSVLLSSRSHRRLAIYNVDPAALDRALSEVLAGLPGRFERTLNGYEERQSERGLTIELAHWFRAAEIAAYGRRPEALVGALGPALRQKLRGQKAQGKAAAWIWFTLAGLTLAAPVVSYCLTCGPKR